MSVDKYLDRTYHPKRYNCLHFVCEVWHDLTGEDTRERLEALLQANLGPTGARKLNRAAVRAFTRLPAPESPCFALLERPGYEPHVGIYIRGRILHITELGVHFFPPPVVAALFSTVKYYK